MAKAVDKHLIAIVDGNPRHREQVSAALLSNYSFATFGDVTNALMGLSIAPPALILVGEQVPPSRGISFIKTLRAERALTQTPVIFISDNGAPDVLRAALEAGANDCLFKPYRRSTLVRAISVQLNARIEGQWRMLPASVRDALEGTLTVFNSIADIADSGAPIQYLAIAESCSPLVDAVQANGPRVLFDAVKEHDNATFTHSFRVAALLALFGGAIGLPRSQQLLLATGGLLHDVGKLSVGYALLNKRDALTAEEWELVRGHVTASVAFLRSCTDVPRGIVAMAAQHHERLDGSGYPAGLEGSQLNELARMAAIADIFANMTEAQVYRDAATAEAAFKTMAEEMSQQLDLKLLQRFREGVLDRLLRPETQVVASVDSPNRA
jgi:HD-GYP domain-containing protein (c-di-GMP phosphodiesterase class II)